MATHPSAPAPARRVKLAAILLGVIALIGVVVLLMVSMSSAESVHVMPDGTTMPSDQMR